VSLLLAAGLMLEHVGKHSSAHRLRAAINATVSRDVIRTPDLGGRASTRQFAEAVARRISSPGAA
jgi:isocitrate dehydrogenase (NAD+)